MQSLTPVIFVDAIEPCLDFWFELGFTKTVEVPEGDALGFVLLKKDTVEVMYQSRASLQNDVPLFASGPFDKSGVGFFVRVGNLDALIPTLEKHEVLVPERKTFYGAREFGVRAPCGSAVTFAEFDQTGS